MKPVMTPVVLVKHVVAEVITAVMPVEYRAGIVE